MIIYYIRLEGRPLPDNDESEEVEGAFINCWVKSKDRASAKKEAVEYTEREGWEVLRIQEISIADPKKYIEVPESMECYDLAVKCGIGAIFYTWPIGGNDE